MKEKEWKGDLKGIYRYRSLPKTSLFLWVGFPVSKFALGGSKQKKKPSELD